MLLGDVQYALRILRKTPGFTLVAVLSLAIGIGANSAMFSLADALLLRPLPVAEPNAVVTVQSKTPSEATRRISYRDYVDFRDRAKSIDSLVAFSMIPVAFKSNPDALPQIKYG